MKRDRVSEEEKGVAGNQKGKHGGVVGASGLSATARASGGAAAGGAQGTEMDQSAKIGVGFSPHAAGACLLFSLREKGTEARGARRGGGREEGKRRALASSLPRRAPPPFSLIKK